MTNIWVPIELRPQSRQVTPIAVRVGIREDGGPQQTQLATKRRAMVTIRSGEGMTTLSMAH